MTKRMTCTIAIAALALTALASTALATPGLSSRAERAYGERWNAAARHYLELEAAQAQKRTSLAARTTLTPQAERALGERWNAIARFFLGTQRTQAVAGGSDAALSPQAERALGERWNAAARAYERSTGYSAAALKAMSSRLEAQSEYYRTLELHRARADASAFHWEDAGVGAAVGAGALLISIAGVLLVRHGGIRPAPSS
jgi:hypothetical protein